MASGSCKAGAGNALRQLQCADFSNAALVQAQHSVGLQRFDHLQVVRDDDEGRALRTQALHLFHDGAHAEKLKASALAQADLHLGPSSDRSALHSEIRSWVREQAKTPEGLLQVKQAMADNDDVAAILWHSPSFLVGLAPSVHEGLRLEALQSRKPELYANLSNSVGLAKLAGKYEAAIRKVAPSFYTPSLAEQASKRVEI